MGLSPKKLWKLTLAEFDYMCWGYQRRQEEDWRRTRWLASVHVNMNRAKDAPPVAPEELLTLPGDPPPAAIDVMAEDEFNRIAALYQ